MQTERAQTSQLGERLAVADWLKQDNQSNASSSSHINFDPHLDINFHLTFGHYLTFIL